MRRFAQIAIAGGLALAAGAGLVTYLTLRPSVLRVAVTAGSDDFAVIVSAAQAMTRERAPVRFRIVPVDSPATSAATLEANEADLAVVRSDIAIPSSGATAVILHRNSIVLMTPPESKFEKIQELKGKTVAYLRADPGSRNDAANEHLLDLILLQYDVLPGSVNRLAVATADIGDIFKDKRADVIMAVGIASTGSLPKAVAAAAHDGDTTPNFIPIPEAEAIAQRTNAFEAIKIRQAAHVARDSRSRFEDCPPAGLLQA